MTAYHTPVLLEQSVAGLSIKPNGIYVDCTFGGGGHSRYILSQLKNGKLLAFDQDVEAIANQPKNENLIMVQGNFRFLRNFIKYHGYDKVDGILADLGVSSHHFDDEKRGFSFRFDGALDMRMNQSADLTAQKVLDTYSVDDLKFVFKQYGELNNAWRIANLIVEARKKKSIQTIGQFKEILQPVTPERVQTKILAKIFQALRIEVNQEMEALKEMLMHTKDVLKSGGRLSVITYHSLEDRLVKNFMRNGMFEGQPQKDLYGNVDVPFKVINRKVIVPDADEIERNNRARSAKLRVAERL